MKVIGHLDDLKLYINSRENGINPVLSVDVHINHFGFSFSNTYIMKITNGLFFCFCI